MSPEELRKHRCEFRPRGIHKQDWWVLVDQARVAAGLPEMVFGHEVVYLRHDNQRADAHYSVSSEAAARSKVVTKRLFSTVLEVRSYTYKQYCRAFGIPGSKM